ncbi:DUF177 domain-containing protein [bacterium]|nr:DUF177 domain-containing protein [bacterium]
MRSIDFKKVSIPLSSVKEGISTFIFRIESPNLQAGVGGRFLSGIDIRVEITTVGDNLFVDLVVKSEGLFECDRCCETFQKVIEGHLHIVYTFDRLKAQGGKDDEIKLIPFGMNEIDITQDVIDVLYLAIPVKKLCRDTCKGLCPQCGVNLNEKDCTCQKEDIDPRWETLKLI